jgi:hypothetical protein
LGLLAKDRIDEARMDTAMEEKPVWTLVAQRPPSAAPTNP